MQNRKVSAIALLVLALFGFSFAHQARSADGDSITVKVDEPGAKIGPMFYGLMTEEINHAYDGGLYAELIQNRIFRDTRRGRGNPDTDPANPPHWSVVKKDGADGDIILDKENPVNTTALTTSLRLDSKGSGGRIGVANDGYWGIPVKPNTQYKASFYAKAGSDDVKGPLKLAIESSDGTTEYATATIPEIGKDWKKYSTTLKTGDVKETADTKFVISTAGNKEGSIWFNLVSLFPPTFKDQHNGFRIDLMEKLAELKPNFLRFPGGNYLEGNTIEERFDWKKTIGPLEERPGHQCPWGYRSSDGLGLLEFLMWCDGLQMEPVLAVYAGYSLRQQRVAAGTDLEPFVQDALDEIEYVTGDASTKWGKRRADDGHPKPFHLTYVEIGNEDNFDRERGSYDKRFTQFYDAIKAKYPKLLIISTIPPIRGRSSLHDLSRNPDVIDDHLYALAPATMQQSNRHNGAQFRGPNVPKIFMGEWASNGRGQGIPTPNLRSAIGDAAFLGGLERNSDVVVMQCYAPLLVNVNPGARQWDTNLIGYDALHSFGSASFYGQKMFSQNRGDHSLPVEVNAARLESASETPAPQPQTPAQGLTARGQVGVGTWATQAEFKDLKVTVGDKVVYSVDSSDPQKGWKLGEGQWKWDGDVLRQSSDSQNCRAMVGDPNWTDFTFTLKARKLAGDEGFLVLFHARDDENYMWWNLGGWNNAYSAIERSRNGNKTTLGENQEVTVQPNRWYDIKVESQGNTIRCYLDGKLVAERTNAPAQGGGRGQAQQAPPAPLYANALRDTANGEVILRLVNTENAPHSVNIKLRGIKSVAKQATVEVLAGEPTDMNSMEDPLKISPKKSTIDNAAESFTHEFPANSLSVVRLKAQ